MGPMVLKGCKDHVGIKFILDWEWFAEKSVDACSFDSTEQLHDCGSIGVSDERDWFVRFEVILRVTACLEACSGQVDRGSGPLGSFSGDWFGALFALVVLVGGHARPNSC